MIVAHENQVQADGKILYSVFGHNDKAFVKVGEQVRAGEIFATVGSEGRSTGPHVHYEVRKNGKTVNPKKYIHRR